MKLFSPRLKKTCYISGRNFPSSKNKKKSYISGNGTFYIFSKRKFSYISRNEFL